MISVCIATYNGSEYILDQIKSILDQLSLNDEIIISDDSSTDNTIVKIRSINDNRIRIIENQVFRNPVYNFENALKHSKGEYIFLSDQDDIWIEEKLSTMLQQLDLGFDLVLSDCKIVNDNFDVLQSSYFKFNGSKKGLMKNLIKNSYMGCCMAFNRKVLNACLPFPPNLPMHDSFIGLIAELRFRVKFISIPLILHRKHSKNTSKTSVGKSSYSLWRKFKIRMNLLKALYCKTRILK